MSKTPRKAGIIVSGGNPWEVLFCLFHLEKNGFLRFPIFSPAEGPALFLSEVDAELARTSMTALGDVKATGLDTIIIPGGRRLFNGISNFQEAGNAFKIHESLRDLIKGIYRLGKPIGAFGSGSVIVTKALQGITKAGPVVTVGSDPRLQSAIASTGAQAVVTRPGEVILDETNLLVSSGGELGSKRPSEVYESCGNVVSALNELISK